MKKKRLSSFSEATQPTGALKKKTQTVRIIQKTIV